MDLGPVLLKKVKTRIVLVTMFYPAERNVNVRVWFEFMMWGWIKSHDFLLFWCHRRATSVMAAMYLLVNGDFQKWGYPKMVGLKGKIP